MSTEYPEIKEQNPLALKRPRDRQERLAQFVSELWAQRHHFLEARRRINKKFANENDWFVRKTLNSSTELLSGYRIAMAMRAIT